MHAPTPQGFLEQAGVSALPFLFLPTTYPPHATPLNYRLTALGGTFGDVFGWGAAAGEVWGHQRQHEIQGFREACGHVFDRLSG